MDRVNEVARAVLYEGYLLWPYRRSALKNRHRWTMGSVAPTAPGDSAVDTGHNSVQTQFLLEVDNAEVMVTATARFLHVVHRQLLRDGEPLDQVRVGDRLYQSWEEAIEREVVLPRRFVGGSICDNGTWMTPFVIPAGGDDELLGGAAGTVLRRSWPELRGAIELAVESVAPSIVRLTVRLYNTTACPSGSATELRRHGLASAHIVCEVAGGRFVSAMDPPERARAEVNACVNTGLWPVLAGEPGDHTTMLAAPMVLYDWPQVSPESPGDLFDATEIDSLLVRTVLAMTSAEREEMVAADPKARDILRRCAALSDDQLWQLHGTLRDPAKEVW